MNSTRWLLVAWMAELTTWTWIRDTITLVGWGLDFDFDFDFGLLSLELRHGNALSVVPHLAMLECELFVSRWGVLSILRSLRFDIEFSLPIFFLDGLFTREER